MERLFKNKFFIVCLSVAVVICGFSTAFALLGYRNLARDTINTLTLPVRLVVSAVSDSSHGFAKYFRSISALEDENETLSKQNEKLAAERLAEENAKKARIREIIADKKDEALKGMSIEELEKLLDK